MSGEMLDLFTPVGSAVISDCARYRYRLDRTWARGPVVAWVMCNPSTADATIDDPTIRKIMGYSKRWGFGSLTVVNLWAWRSPDPSSLPFTDAAIDVVGPDCNAYLRTAVEDAGMVVCGWGSSVHRRYRDPRAEQVKGIIHLARHVPRALKINADGSPAHPLYMRGDLTAEPMS